MLPAARAAYTPYKTGLRPQWSLAAGDVYKRQHVMHPGSPAEERRTDERRTAQVAGGKVFMADQHHHRRADAQGKRL